MIASDFSNTIQPAPREMIKQTFQIDLFDNTWSVREYVDNSAQVRDLNVGRQFPVRNLKRWMLTGTP